MNLYEVLGVSRNAATADIKAAYRKLAMTWHPDRNPGNERLAAEKFKELAHAYSILGDETKRQRYDDALNLDEAAVDDEDVDMKTAAEMFLDAMIELAADMASRGYNRDVILGALLNQGCPEHIAREISSEVWRQHSKRTASPNPKAAPKPSPKPAEPPPTASSARPQVPQQPSQLGNYLLAGFAVLAFFVWLSSSQKGPRVQNLPAAEYASPTAVPPTAPPPEIPKVSVIEQQIPSYSPATKSGTIRYQPFPAESDLGKAFNDYVYRDFEIKLIGEQPVDKTGTQRFYYFSSRPILREKYDCHPCAPLVSAMMTKKAANGDESIVTPLTILGRMGTFGEYFGMERELPSIVDVAPGKKGIVFKDSDMGQGNYFAWLNLFSIEREGFRHLLTLDTEASNTGTGNCDKTMPGSCVDLRVKIRFDKSSTAGGFYPLRVTESGYKYDKDYKPIPATENYVMKFTGNKYERATPPTESNSTLN